MLELRCYRVKYKPSHPENKDGRAFLFVTTDHKGTKNTTFFWFSSVPFMSFVVKYQRGLVVTFIFRYERLDTDVMLDHWRVYAP